MKYLKVFSQYALGTGITFLIGLVTTPVLTRLIPTESMGRYSIFVTVCTVASMLLYLGLDQAYTRFYYEEEPKRRVNLLFSCLKYPLWMTAAVSVLVLVFYRQVSVLLVGEESLLTGVMFCVSLFGLVTGRFFLLKVRMAQKALAFSALNAARKLSYLLLSLLLIFTVFGANYQSLITAVSIAPLVTVVCVRIIERGDWKQSKSKSSITRRQLFSYGFPFILTTSITYLFSSTDQLMLKLLTDYRQIGLYAGALNIVSLLNQVKLVFVTLWAPVAFEHYSKDPENKAFFVKANKLISYIMLMAALVLLCCRDIIILFLGPDYRGADVIFPFLIFMPIMYTISETTVMGINFMKKTHYHIWITGICLVFNILGNYLLIQWLGAKGAAISTGLSYVLFFALRTAFAHKALPIPFALKRLAVCVFLVYALACYAGFFEITAVYILAAAAVGLVISWLYRDILSVGFRMVQTGIKNRKKAE